MMSSANEKKHPVKVSVVLPTFNQSHYLLDAIQSILNQTFEDFELIIVNDGSTDDTTKYLSAISHPKLRVVTQQNQGLPNALNNGFAQARGQYWTWTSTDNVVAPTWLEELVKALDKSPAEVGYAFSHYAGIDDSGKILFIHRDQRFDLPTLLMRHTGNASFMYRAELARKVGNYDAALSHAEDLDMWVRMAEHTSAALVETVLYYYRIHNQSMTAQTDKVRRASQGVVDKYLAKSGGKFDIDALFPSIKLSADPALERWKARIWLVTIGANATYYCPVDAMIDQLACAIKEKYEPGLVGNMVHLFAKNDRWDAAAQVVTICQQAYPSDFLTQLANIIARQAKSELQKIPFLTLEEKWMACDCKGPRTQKDLQRNLAPAKPVRAEQAPHPYEKLLTELAAELEDMKDHPEVWQNIASLKSPEEKKSLQHLRLYLSELTTIPQEPQILILLKIIEAMCLAYTDQAELGKNTLKELNRQHPNLPILMGALLHLYQDETLYAGHSRQATASASM